MSGKAKVAKKRGKKPAQKVVRQNPNPPNRIEDTDDKAEYLLQSRVFTKNGIDRISARLP